MAEKRLRVGERLTHYDPVPQTPNRPPHPEQWLAGQYGGKWEVASSEERHWDVTAQEALTAMQHAKGRLRVAILGAYTEYKAGVPGDGKTLEFRDAIVKRGSQQEKELEQIVKDVAQFKADARAQLQAGQRDPSKLSRSNANFAVQATKRYEQERMREWVTNVTGWEYTRVHAIAFSEAPVRQPGRRKR